MTDNRRQLNLLIVYGAGLVLIGAFRWATLNLDALAGLTAGPTIAFVVLTVIVALRIVHSPIGWGGVGFALPFAPLRHIALGLAGAAVAIGVGFLIDPYWISLFGETPDLTRFESAATLPGLFTLLAFSWTFAAFGEEFAFRGVLMSGLASALGGGRVVIFMVLVLQAIVFGLVHVYQGPAGVAATTVTGLIFGVVVLIGRGSLWPAILAHGFTNTFGLVSLWLQSS